MQFDCFWHQCCELQTAVDKIKMWSCLRQPSLSMPIQGRLCTLKWERHPAEAFKCKRTEIQNHLISYGSLESMNHDPYRSQSTRNGSHHWCFYSLEILRCVPRIQVVSSWWVPFQFWRVDDAGRNDFRISKGVFILPHSAQNPIP